jgi:hypothetical protein
LRVDSFDFGGGCAADGALARVVEDGGCAPRTGGGS